MSKSQITKENLLEQGKRLFWARGYSNVPLREISKAAGVDVALISRYFGGKLQLFEATLDDLPVIDPNLFPNTDALITAIVGLFVNAPRDGTSTSAVTMILMNAGDEEVGEMVREKYHQNWQTSLDEIIGDKSKSALFSAAVLGISIAEKTLHLDGIAEPKTKEYENQLRSLLRVALGDAT